MKIFIFVFITLSFAFSVHAQKQVQVIVTSTYLRKEPNLTAEKVQTVQKGDSLALEKNQALNGWYYVSAANGAVKGWIRKDTVGSPQQAPTAEKAAPPAAANKNENNDTDVRKPKRTVPAARAPVPKTPVISAPRRAPPPVAAVVPTPIAEPPAVAAPPVPVPSPTPEEEEVIRVATEEVILNVRVVDAGNRAVKNLNQSQFKIYEDGVLQTITSVSTTEAPMINALLIDNSRSLRSQLKSIIEAGKIIVGTNRAADETAVIRFVGSDKIEVVRDFTTSKTALNDGLDNLFVEGGQTAIIDAVYLAAEKIEQRKNSAQKDDIRLRALVLVSDGDDRSSSHDEKQLFDLLRKSQVQIYAVGFVNNLSREPDAGGVNRREKAKSLLKNLTEETGGRAYFPDSIDELAQIAADISGELHAQYSITYTPTNESRDGSFRKLKVEIDEGSNKEKRIAVARAGRISANK